MKLFLTMTFLCFVFEITAQNTALQFNGTTQYINIADDNSIDLSANFTLEGWLYPAGVGSNSTEGGMIINKEASYEIARFADGTFRYAMSANGNGSDWAWTNTNIVIPLNTWSHFALVKSGTNVTLYLNAVNVFSVSSAPATMAANTSPLRIANRSNVGHFFDGSMDEIRIWNTARTAADIKNNMFNKNLLNSAAGMVIYYRMNEGSGTSSTANACTNFSGLNGTLINAPTWVSSPIQFAGNALNFDGTDDFVVIPHTVSGDFTVEFWMRTTSTGSGTSGSQWYGGNGIVDAEVAGGTNDWGTSLTGQYLAFGIGNPDLTIHSTSVVNTGNWVHVAASWQQSTGSMRLYINGVQEATATGSTSLRSAPPRITIGQLQTNIQRFSGSVDEVRIWNVVRTQAQIMANKDIELDPNGAATANMVAYYTFNQNNTANTNSGVVTVIDQKNTNNGTLTNFALSGSSSNFVAQKSGFATLPVELLSFTAIQLRSSVQLVWKTATEQNTSAFIIERSADGQNWTSIAQLPAVGNSNSVQQYSYTDAAPLSGQNFYRLRQTDNDGKQSYSEIKNIRFTTAVSSLAVLGNPVTNGQLKIQWNESANMRAELYDGKGELLLSVELKQGINTINVNQLASGIYWLRTANESKKIMLQ